jgi:tyrosine-specific transport protein
LVVVQLLVWKPSSSFVPPHSHSHSHSHSHTIGTTTSSSSSSSTLSNKVIALGSNYNKGNKGSSTTSSLKVLRSPFKDGLITSSGQGQDGSSSSSSSSTPPVIIASYDDDDDDDDGESNSSSNTGFFSFDGLSEKIGRVEDDRIIFPEYETGEVPRIFSSLQYSRTDRGVVEAKHASGSVLGAASLVAGTMVGAGILALPAATAPAGFLPSTVAMGVGWFYMTMSGLLIAELSINRLGQSGKPGQGILDLFEDSLGPQWSKVGSAAYFGLHYCLLVAYIAQGGANMNALLGLDAMGVAGLPQISFAAVCAVFLYAASPAVVEKANNLFVVMLSVAFLGIISLGASTADFHSLVDLSNQHPEKVPDAFPIIFLSLVYHNIVPTVVNQLEGDRSKITQAIIGGTTVPALMFLAWNAVVLGNIDPSMADSGIDPVTLLQSISAGSSNELMSNLVTTFSSLALVTSLIGFVYGLLDGWTDVFRLPTEGPAFDKWKAPLFGLVFLPPLALSMSDPEIFYKALDFGGAFGVSTLFLVLPPIMVWKQRYGDEQQPLLTKPMGKRMQCHTDTVHGTKRYLTLFCFCTIANFYDYQISFISCVVRPV